MTLMMAHGELLAKVPQCLTPRAPDFPHNIMYPDEGSLEGNDKGPFHHHLGTHCHMDGGLVEEVLNMAEVVIPAPQREGDDQGVGFL